MADRNKNELKDNHTAYKRHRKGASVDSLQPCCGLKRERARLLALAGWNGTGCHPGQKGRYTAPGTDYGVRGSCRCKGYGFTRLENGEGYLYTRHDLKAVLGRYPAGQLKRGIYAVLRAV